MKSFNSTVEIYLISKIQNEFIFQQQLNENEIYDKFISCKSKYLIPITTIYAHRTANGNFSNTEIKLHIETSYLNDPSLFINSNNSIENQKEIIEKLKEEYEFLIYLPKRNFYFMYPSQQFEILDYHHFCLLRVNHDTVKDLVEKSEKMNEEQTKQIEIQLKYSSFLENVYENGHYNFKVYSPMIINDHKNVELMLTMISAHQFKKQIIVGDVKYVDDELYDKIATNSKYTTKRMEDIQEVLEIVEKNEILYKSFDMKGKSDNLLKKKIEVIVIIEDHLMISSILCDDKQSPFLLDESKSFLNLSSKRTDYFGGYLNIYNISKMAKEEEQYTSCIFVVDLFGLENKCLEIAREMLKTIENHFINNQIMTIFRVNERRTYAIKNHHKQLIGLFEYIVKMRDEVAEKFGKQTTREILHFIDDKVGQEIGAVLNELQIEKNEIIESKTDLNIKTFIEEKMENKHHHEIVCLSVHSSDLENDLQLLMNGNAITLFTFSKQLTLNIYQSLEFSLIHLDENSYENDKKEIENHLLKIVKKFKLPEVKYNEATITINFNYPYFSLNNRKTILFLTSSNDVKTIIFDNLQPKRNAFSCINAIEYLYHQTMEWKIKNDPKITAKTIMRQIKLSSTGPKRGTIAAVKRSTMVKQISPLDSLNHIDPSLMNQKIDSIGISRINKQAVTSEQSENQLELQMSLLQRTPSPSKKSEKEETIPKNTIDLKEKESENNTNEPEAKVNNRNKVSKRTLTRGPVDRRRGGGNVQMGGCADLSAFAEQQNQETKTDESQSPNKMSGNLANVNIANLNLGNLNLSSPISSPQTTGRQPPARKKMVRLGGVDDFRKQRMIQFKNVVQQTGTDKSGLEYIMIGDVYDRLLHQYITKCNGNIPEDFKTIVKNVYDSHKWSEMVEKKDDKEYIPLSKIDPYIDILFINKSNQTNKPTNSNETQHKRFFSQNSHIGPKTRMEDYDYFIEDMRLYDPSLTEKISYIGVYDGHVGPACADYTVFKIHNEILRHKQFPDDIKTAISESIATIETNYKSISKSYNVNAGTTAGIILITEKKIVTANLGDTEIVLSKKTQPFNILSVKHTCANIDEKKRIEEAGGHIRFNNGDRVEGVLLVTRSIGDEALKHCVTCEPSMFEIPLDGDEEFIICASDGMWDVFDYGDAVLLVKELMRSEYKESVDKLGVSLPKDMNDIARYLVDLALKKGSKDNVTVSICFF